MNRILRNAKLEKIKMSSKYFAWVEQKLSSCDCQFTTKMANLSPEQYFENTQETKTSAHFFIEKFCNTNNCINSSNENCIDFLRSEAY